MQGISSNLFSGGANPLQSLQKKQLQDTGAGVPHQTGSAALVVNNPFDKVNSMPDQSVSSPKSVQPPQGLNAMSSLNAFMQGQSGAQGAGQSPFFQTLNMNA